MNLQCRGLGLHSGTAAVGFMPPAPWQIAVQADFKQDMQQVGVTAQCSGLWFFY